MQTPNQKIGILGEQLAQKYLKDKGYNIVALNYKKFTGEIDIIAEKEKVISFVEVKTNSRHNFNFNPELRVNSFKMQNIVRTANLFIMEKGLQEVEWQIDIIAITFDSRSQKADIKHFKRVSL